jgi:hypothetical protein
MLLVLLIRIRLLFFKNCIFYFTFKGSLYLICPGPLNVQGQPAYKASKENTRKNTRKPLSTTHLQTAGTPETAAQISRPSYRETPNSRTKKKKKNPKTEKTNKKKK